MQHVVAATANTKRVDGRAHRPVRHLRLTPRQAVRGVDGLSCVFLQACKSRSSLGAELTVLTRKQAFQAYKNEVYLLPKPLDEYCDEITDSSLGAELTVIFSRTSIFSRCQGCKPFQACKNEGDCLDVARYSSVRELRTLERVFRSCQSFAHRTPTGTLIRSSQSFEKRERLNSHQIQSKL